MIGGLALSFILKFLPGWIDLAPLYDIALAAPNKAGVYEIPFIDRMGIVFVFCVLGMVIISLADPKSKNNPKGWKWMLRCSKHHRHLRLGPLSRLVS
ncbi:hypothetical protein [Chitinophaga sedimenti]|uniref:hypothetical protein n=1 Tax=Chitinophaga sedimenti TaxID=2033606 RepID=UPI0027E16E31|nr:hypothetical protein [Chitinophaga sedimenti]